LTGYSLGLLSDGFACFFPGDFYWTAYSFGRNEPSGLTVRPEAMRSDLNFSTISSKSVENSSCESIVFSDIATVELLHKENMNVLCDF